MTHHSRAHVKRQMFPSRYGVFPAQEHGGSVFLSCAFSPFLSFFRKAFIILQRRKSLKRDLCRPRRITESLRPSLPRVVGNSPPFSLILLLRPSASLRAGLLSSTCRAFLPRPATGGHGVFLRAFFCRMVRREGRRKKTTLFSAPPCRAAGFCLAKCCGRGKSLKRDFFQAFCRKESWKAYHGNGSILSSFSPLLSRPAPPGQADFFFLRLGRVPGGNPSCGKGCGVSGPCFCGKREPSARGEEGEDFGGGVIFSLAK